MSNGPATPATLDPHPQDEGQAEAEQTQEEQPVTDGVDEQGEDGLQRLCMDNRLDEEVRRMTEM
ncbi:hypothetical protein Q604_UNBC05816G0001, partial [human gut metagenome]